jgi:hypothetical protein
MHSESLSARSPFAADEISDITRSIVSRYCDWQISDAVSAIDAREVNQVLQTYRNAARRASFVGSPSRPGYEERPTQSDKPIERCVMQVIRSAAVYFREPKFLVPLEWKKVTKTSDFNSRSDS